MPAHDRSPSAKSAAVAHVSGEGAFPCSILVVTEELGAVSDDLLDLVPIGILRSHQSKQDAVDEDYKPLLPRQVPWESTISMGSYSCRPQVLGCFH